MHNDSGDPFALGAGDLVTVPPHPSPAQSSSISSQARTAEHDLSVTTLVEQCRREIQAYRRSEPTDGASSLELFRRALLPGGQDAQKGVEHCLSELVRGWLYSHPRREAALSRESEERHVALAFEHFWQAPLRQQAAFKTLAGALVFLRASLGGTLLDTLRATSRPGEVPFLEPGNPSCEDRPTSLDLWEILQKVLQSERESRVAYLLYHCNLKPLEIVCFCQEEWPDVQEIYRLRRNILELLLRKAGHWQDFRLD